MFTIGLSGRTRVQQAGPWYLSLPFPFGGLLLLLTLLLPLPPLPFIAPCDPQWPWCPCRSS